MTVDWQWRAARLADQLSASGALTSSGWHGAFRAVPRHELVPTYYRPGPDGWTRLSTRTPDGLDLAYSNTALFTVPGGCSSSSMPGVMIRMLEALDLDADQRVLEIGTGSGYNAALLCHRLGEDRVFSVDLDPDLVSVARRRLGTIGYHPTLAARDGATGLAEHAPYDRVIATCSVDRIPPDWIAQCRVGGLVLADLKIAENAGNLVLLRVGRDRAEGRFLPQWGGFMPMRSTGTEPPARRAPRDRSAARRRLTAVDRPRPWEDLGFWFFAQLSGSLIASHGQRRDDVTGQPADAFLVTADGSWCEVAAQPDRAGQRTVWESGPRSVWEGIEAAHRRWLELGEPTWDRFGLTVTPELQTVWLDRPDSSRRWTLGRPGA